MKENEYMTTSQAAELAGVTTQTIRNLCKEGTLAYQKHSHLYYPKREDVEKYKTVILDVHEKSKELATYQAKLEQELENTRTKINVIIENTNKCLADLRLFPRRIYAIKETLFSVLKHYSEQHDPDMTPRELEIMFDMLDGCSLEEISDKHGLTKERSRQIWFKTLRKFARTKNELERKDEEIEELVAEISNLEDEIYFLRNGVPQAEKYDMIKLLQTRIYDLDFSVRTIHGLKASEVITVLDLVKQEPSQLLRIRNFGKKSMLEIRDFLREHKLCFGMDVTFYEKYLQLS